MKGRRDPRADTKTCLHNFESQIAQFPIKTGDYGAVLLDYFKICPYTQKLETDWQKISLELGGALSIKNVPHWVCSHYYNCDHNEQCHPPFRCADAKYKYMRITDLDYVTFVDTVGADGKKQLTQKSSIGKFLIESNDKVLVSPARLVKTRTGRKYSQDQVANICGLTKQTISNWEIIRESPQQRLNCIATKNGLITMKYSLCCLLAALYEVTPGYLMGQTDDPSRDIYVHNYVYIEKNKISPDDLSFPLVYEEYEISRGLDIPILLFSQKKRAGRMAADRIREYSDCLDDDYQLLLELCEKIYYRPVPQKLQRDLRLLFEGLLDSTNTIAGSPGIREIVQPLKT